METRKGISSFSKPKPGGLEDMLQIEIGQGGEAVVSGALLISSIEDFYKELAKLFNDGNCSVLDLRGVTEIDTAALQVLIAFKKSLIEINRNVDLIAGSSIREVLGLSGLTKLFRAA